MQLAILGPVRAWRGEAELGLGPPQQRGALAFLALNAGRGALESSRSGYTLAAGATLVDLDDFCQLADQAPAMRARGAGVRGHYVDKQRGWLNELRLTVPEEWFSLALDLGCHAEVIAELTKVVTAEPFRERMRELLMVAFPAPGTSYLSPAQRAAMRPTGSNPRRRRSRRAVPVKCADGRKLMITKQGAAALVVCAAALSCVAGCQQGTAAVSPTASSSSAGTAAATSTPATSTPAASGTTGASGATSGASISSGAAGTKGTPSCALAELAVAISSPHGPSGGQQTVSITFTSKAASSCYLYGFPGVDLVGNKLTWPLMRSGPAPERVVLPPRGEAHSTLTFLAWARGDSASFTPTQVEVTPPGGTEHATLPWTPGGPIVLQNEATRPGTYIGPVSSDS